MARTTPDPDRPGRRRRVGLVLGAGGTLGATWMIGALGAVQERIGRPLGEVDVLVGTSAGSVLAASLRYGMTPDDLVAHQRGTTSPDLPDLEVLERDSGRLPSVPRLRLGSPRLLARAVRSPHLVHPHVAMSAWAPRGRKEHHALRHYMHRLVQTRGTHAHARVAHAHAAHSTASRLWPERHTWIMAVDYESGRRVAFGRPGTPAVHLPDAVVASCSIPGWHAPKRIDGRVYVDGGVRSAASVDVLHRERLDEVYVLAPMASHETERPRSPLVRAERFVRQMTAQALEREVRRVRAAGTTVHTLMPGPDDPVAIGANLMDGRRRQRVLETSLATSAHRLREPDTILDR
ncbi:patatin-like phospholipase family protein [Virgisporangium ochraceum]